MDSTISSVFGSDNPFKFFFLSGIVLLVIGLYFPVEKRRELDLKKNDVEFSDSTLIVEIVDLNVEIDRLSKDADKLLIVLDSLTSGEKNGVRRNSISKMIDDLKAESREKFSEIELKKDELAIKTVTSNFKNREIKIYESHLSELKLYSWGFVIIGLILLAYGGWYWLLYFKKNA